MSKPIVSAIITTYNRAHDVRIAVATAVGQTYPSSALEILVVDDGGTDNTEAVLVREFGDRVRYLRKPNGGVSAARNFGMQNTTGEYIALLDDDDEWRPEKLEKQAEVLTNCPEIDMVLTDVEQMNRKRTTVQVYSRRAQLPSDGWVLPAALRTPLLTPSSAMFRREVFEATGGFNPALATAEDLDFFLRVALPFQVAVIEEPLTRAMRGHAGLSGTTRTCHDYLQVVEGFIRDHAQWIAPVDCEAALFWAYTKNARGFMWEGDYAEAARLTGQAAIRARTSMEIRELRTLGFDLAKNVGVRFGRWMFANWRPVEATSAAP